MRSSRAHVGKAQRPPEAPGQVEVHPGHLRHLDLGVAALGGDEQPVGDEEVEHVARLGFGDLVVGRAMGAQEGAHPFEGRLGAVDSELRGHALAGRRIPAWPSAT